ncbi:hypothetical protein ABW21_db0209284 [Orbilia brochopaga]|nr:hypothetical protein ABW21_db0209284 [Drechslerella brochopaga]
MIMLLAARRPRPQHLHPRLLFPSSSRSLVFFVHRVSHRRRQSPDPADAEPAPKHPQPYHHHCYSHHRHSIPASWLSAWADYTPHAKRNRDPPLKSHYQDHHHHSIPQYPRPHHHHHHQHSLKDLYYRITRLRDQHVHQWTSPARQQALAAATALRVSLVARLREMSKPYTRSKPQHRDAASINRSPDPPASPAAVASDAPPAAPHAVPPLNATTFSRVETPDEDTEVDYITLKRVPKQETTSSSSDANLPSKVQTGDVQSPMQATATAGSLGATVIEPMQANCVQDSQPEIEDAGATNFQQTPVEHATVSEDKPSKSSSEEDNLSSTVHGEVNMAASTPAIDTIRGQQDFYIDDTLYGKVTEQTETISLPEPLAEAESSLDKTNMIAIATEAAASATGADEAAAVSSSPSAINVEPTQPESNPKLDSDPAETLISNAQTTAIPSGPEEAPDAGFIELETPSAAIDPPKMSPADLIASLRYYDRRRGTLPDEEPLSAQDIAILEAFRKADEGTSDNARAKSNWSSKAKTAGLVVSSVVLGTYVVGVGNKLLTPQPDSSAAAEMLTAVQRSRVAK